MPFKLHASVNTTETNWFRFLFVWSLFLVPCHSITYFSSSVFQNEKTLTRYSTQSMKSCWSCLDWTRRENILETCVRNRRAAGQRIFDPTPSRWQIEVSRLVSLTKFFLVVSRHASRSYKSYPVSSQVRQKFFVTLFWKCKSFFTESSCFTRVNWILIWYRYSDSHINNSFHNWCHSLNNRIFTHPNSPMAKVTILINERYRSFMLNDVSSYESVRVQSIIDDQVSSWKADRIMVINDSNSS